ncbi:hypothetical protein BH20VER1_BH20VER1_30290 [soil metagenome]|jgi:hypothetical protein
MTPTRWAAGLLLISTALLGFELLLMRLLALAYWGHFAGFVISTAMLGLASSGLFLHFRRERIRERPEWYFAISAGLFGIVAPVAFLCSQALPFTPFLLTWSPREYALLAGRSLLFFGSFFVVGIAVGTPFVARVLPMGRLYFWNMVGSGLPALPLLLAMNFLHPMRLLAGVTVLGVVVALLSGPAEAGPSATGSRAFGIVMKTLWLLVGAGVVVAVTLTPFRYSEYKELPRTLLLPEARVLEERYGWDGVVQIVDSPHTRYLPGLSLNFTGTLPPSQLVFTDAGAMTLVVQPSAEPDGLEFLHMTPEAFSFVLLKPQSLLHLYGGTADLLRAHATGVRDLRVVDDSETRVETVRSLLAPELRQHLVRADARQILARESRPLDVIALSLLGTHGTSTAGAASLDPSFLLTVEGFSRIFARLSAGGHAVTSTWVENPARSGVRLVALWIETLRRNGIAEPSRHLLALRSWSTVTIFVGREAFGAAAVEALRSFAEENSFDLVWYHGIDPAQTNTINIIPEDPYYEAFAALLGEEREQFTARSAFAIDAPGSDRPFFNQYFRWAAVPEWMRTMGMEWLPFVEWGYILHVATLVVVTLLGVLLLLVPAAATRSSPAPATALLFFMLGVAYMFVQIWAIYRLSQFVAHPLLAASLVLSGMLVASGTGAAVLTRRPLPGRTFVFLCAAIGAAIAVFPLMMSVLFPAATSLRAVAGVAWLAVPAFFMGFPFPYSLGRLRKDSDIPWALALNGFGSVVGALLATLVAVHLGLLVLALSALLFYAAVALLSRRMPARVNS